MDDEQLAARRAQIPVHCAACGGEFPGTTKLHNGICDACQKLTHGPNYRLIAKLQDQERLIERLRGEFDRVNARAFEHRAEIERLRAQHERDEIARAGAHEARRRAESDSERLRAENAIMRAALEGQTNG